MKYVALLFLLVVGGPTLAADTKPLRVLMVTGGCCHDYGQQKLILAEGISARANVEFTVVHEEGRDKADKTHKVSIYEKADWAKGFDCVLHNECFGAVEDVAFVERIARAHFDGVPAVMLHCSTHSYRMAGTDEWRKCVGQKSMSHEKRRDLLVKNLKPEHPVMKGFPAEWLDKSDELYKNEVLFEHFVPLASAWGEETRKDHSLVWVNTYGKARVFGTTMGHENATMSDPVYLDLVTRGLLWACGKLGDDGKPVAGYDAKQK
ncbi:MAG: ThuA domain-containing protein [Verrucomicrobiaceae bacterium]